jgi:hypothetical protein
MQIIYLTGSWFYTTKTVTLVGVRIVLKGSQACGQYYWNIYFPFYTPFLCRFSAALFQIVRFEIPSVRLLFVIYPFQSEAQITSVSKITPPQPLKMFYDCPFHLLDTRQQVRLIWLK